MATISPDASVYVDLTVFDRTPSELVDRAKADAAVKLPGWVARAGTNEVVLLEAMALEVAELVNAVNRLPSATVEVLLRLFGITLDTGAPATTTVTFTLSDSLGHTIPAGTRLRLDLGDGTPLVFATDTNLVVAAASSTGTVGATADAKGATPNGTIAGTPLDLLDNVIFVDTAEVASTVVNGRDREGSAAYFSRAIQRLQRLTSVLVLPAHFTAAALEDADVFRALTIDLYDGAGGPPYTDVGHVTVVVRGASGNLSGPQKTALAATLDAQALASIVVHVIDPTVTNVNVTATAVAKAGYDTATVQASIVAALTAFLDPSVWPWAATVRRNDLIALIEDVPGVDYLTAGHPTVPAADVALSGDGPLANIGTLTITVT